MMGVKESEIQLIFDEIISANYSEYQEYWITVDGKSLKNTLTNYEQNGQNMCCLLYTSPSPRDRG